MRAMKGISRILRNGNQVEGYNLGLKDCERSILSLIPTSPESKEENDNAGL